MAEDDLRTKHASQGRGGSGLRKWAGSHLHQQKEREKGSSDVPYEKRVKLLISIVNSGDDRRISELMNDVSIALSVSCMGTGTARSAVLSYLGIGTAEKKVMISLIPECDEEIILQEIHEKMAIYLVGNGISFTIPISAVSEIVANGIVSASVNKSLDGRKHMNDTERKYDLVVCIVSTGYVDDAMEAARRAGAAGGTVLRSRSLDNAKPEHFIGITLQEESEILLILVKRDAKLAIMNALKQSVGLKTNARGLILSLPVDRAVGIGVSGVRSSSADTEEKKGEEASVK